LLHQKKTENPVFDIKHYNEVDLIYPAKNSGITSLMQSKFGLPEEYSFEFMNQEKDDMGQYHNRFRQYYKNIPVEGSMVIVHSQKNKIF
jgi:Zn-dependent metalloprotease